MKSDSAAPVSEWQADEGAELQWAISAAESRFPPPVRVDGVERLVSRVSPVHRITLHTAAGPRSCFLKRVAHEDGSVDRLEFFSRLMDVASVLGGREGVLMLPIIATDPRRGLLLTEQMPGQPVSAVRRAAVTSSLGRRHAANAWLGLGRFLASLHGMRPPALSTSAPALLARQTAIRLAEWGGAIRADARLADQARERLDRLMQALEGRPVRTTLCHGDIAVGNIFVDGCSAGLIDFDDLRIDLPAIDVSQALIAAAGFARVGPLPVPGLESRLKRAFFEGYGTAGTIDAEFLLAHLRNLAVGLQTLACAAGPVTWSRRSHLLQLRGELRRTLTAVDRRRDKQGPS